MPIIVRTQVRPIRAYERLGGHPVRPDPAVQRAADPIILEVPAGGDDLALDDVGANALGLAQVRRAPRQEQGLQVLRAPPVRRGHDLQREVPAARGAAGVVGGAAGCAVTGVASVVDDRQGSRPGRPRCQIQASAPAAVYQGQTAIGMLDRAHAGGPSGGWERTGESMRAASRRARALTVSLRPSPSLTVRLEIPARHVHHGVREHAPPAHVRSAERHVLAVAEEPRGQSVAGWRLVVEVSDAERHPELTAVAAHGPAGRSAGRPARESGWLGRGRAAGHVGVESS